MSRPGFEEKRKSKRFDLPLEIECRTLTTSPETYSAVTRNVGRGGVAMRLPNEIERGVTLQMRLAVPGSQAPVSAMGRVAWVEGGHLGIRWTRIDRVDQERILEYIYQSWLAGQPKLFAKRG